MTTNARDHEMRKEIIREQQAEIKELTHALAASRKKCERLRTKYRTACDMVWKLRCNGGEGK